MKIMVIIGSVRKDRAADNILKQLTPEFDKFPEIDWDIVDLKDLKLPFFDEALSPNTIDRGEGEYTNPGGKAWADRVSEADGYIFVTPEYNHGYPAVLKNALDWVGAKHWGGKPVTMVGYGAASGGMRAVEQLRQVVIELRLHPLHDAVHIPNVYAAFNEAGELLDERKRDAFATMLDELLAFLATRHIAAAV